MAGQVERLLVVGPGTTGGVEGGLLLEGTVDHVCSTHRESDLALQRRLGGFCPLLDCPISDQLRTGRLLGITRIPLDVGIGITDHNRDADGDRRRPEGEGRQSRRAAAPAERYAASHDL